MLGGPAFSNRIEVKPKVTPQEVKGNIEEALRRSAELNARRIIVEVWGSKVKLYGSASATSWLAHRFQPR
jgi:osmotically-inducible protein OsmY